MLLDSNLNILQGGSNRILLMLYNVYRTTFARIIFGYESIGNSFKAVCLEDCFK